MGDSQEQLWSSGTRRGSWLEGLEELTSEDCLLLLRSHELGRVGFQFDEQPIIFPVNYRLLANGVVFRTAPGTKLKAAMLRSRVAFEVDEADASGPSGWSVLVVGRAAEVTDPASLQEAERLGVSPWAPGSRDHFVVIHAEEVSGRRFGGP